MPIVGSGIIPAHAGNTLTTFDSPKVFKDHPRSCGEYAVVGVPAVVEEGSSPLMRGILKHPKGEQHYDRIIPAHAGNTLFRKQRKSLL